MSEEKCSFCDNEPIVQFVNTIGEGGPGRGIGFYCRQLQMRKRVNEE